MRKLTPEARQERRRQVIKLRRAGWTYEAIAADLGLSRTGVFDICRPWKTSLAGVPSGYCEHCQRNTNATFAAWSLTTPRIS